MPDPQFDITAFVNQLADCPKDSQALNWLYKELRRIANRHLLGESPGHTLQATALVNEALLELLPKQHAQWKSRAHFLAYASQIMRHVLVQHARAKRAQKRGGNRVKVSLHPNQASEDPIDLVELDLALDRLRDLDPRKAQLVVWKFFGGLSMEEMAACSGLAHSTIHLELKKARGWLFHQLGGRA